MSKILIIDDEAAVREELRDRIESMGHEVEEATSVEEALKCIEEVSYDCILLDLGIPLKFEGPTRVHHGKNLLQRIVASPSAPPVLVITANGLNDWQLSSEVHDNGAKGFIGKPFDEYPVEDKIRKLLEAKDSEASRHKPQRDQFAGGNIVMHADRIELCEEEVGGTKGNALIRQILPHLARKNERSHYIKASRGDLATAIGVSVGEPAIANAIKEFREKCTLKLGCGQHDVIITHRGGGGYQLADWITFQIGSEEKVHTQAEMDQAAVMKELRRFKQRTRRQISDRVGIPQARVKAALSKLDDAKKVNLKGSGTNSVYFIREEVNSESAATTPVAQPKKGGSGRAVPAR